MKGWLIDAYRCRNELILWIQSKDQTPHRMVYPFTMNVYADPSGRSYCQSQSISYQLVERSNYLNQLIPVLKIPIPELSRFESFVKDFEQKTRHRVPLYNADIKPEQMFLYEHDLKPFDRVEFVPDGIQVISREDDIPLKVIRMSVEADGDIYDKFYRRLRRVVVDGCVFEGRERDVLEGFARHFKAIDPDVIVMDYAYVRFPYLAEKLAKYKIVCPLHRWDAIPVRYSGGKSFWSYGEVKYRDYAVKLRGRFLVDTNSFVGTECDVEGVIEMTRLSGTLFQSTVARSFGAVFQNALVRLMVRKGILVPYKEKPIERPLTMFQMLKADRGGHIYDPKVGFHTNVAEIDFTSMFPWLIYNNNISADSILSDEGPFDDVPGVPIRTTKKFRGLIPEALKPFIDRRMYYKNNPSDINRRRSKGLKWVLVSCYGYLRFREFKLGIPTSHMAICAFSREMLLQSVELAQQHGFEVVHAIVDSLFIRKDGITAEEVEAFCRELEKLTRIPLSFEGIFNWIVFLPSVVDPKRALPSTYYGVFGDGSIKARGIEIRQRSAPNIVKEFQQAVINALKDCRSQEEIHVRVTDIIEHASQMIKALPQSAPERLTVTLRVGRTKYKANVPQKIIVERLQRRGVRVVPGKFIQFIYAKNGPVLLDEYQGDPDADKYARLLIRALFVLLQPLGYSRKALEDCLKYHVDTGRMAMVKG